MRLIRQALPLLAAIAIPFAAQAGDPPACSAFAVPAGALTSAEAGIGVRLQRRFEAPAGATLTDLGRFATMSEDGARIAYTMPAAGGGVEILAFDVESGASISRERFASVKSIHFIGGSDLIAFVGARLGETAKHAFVYSLAPLRQLTEGQALVVPGSGRSRASGVHRLDIPESTYQGASLDGLIARPDLPFAMAIRHSTNPLATVLRPNWASSPGGSFTTSRADYGVTLLDVATLRPRRELMFGDLAPVAAALNPRSDLIAFALQNPLASEIVNDSVVVARADAPATALFSWHSNRAGKLLVPIDGGYSTRTRAASNDVQTIWSEDGGRLLILERLTGTSIEWDAATGATLSSDVRSTVEEADPIAGGLLRRDGGAVFLRQDLESVVDPIVSGWSARGYAFARGEARDFSRRPDFAVRLDFSGLPPSLWGSADSAFRRFSRFIEMRDGRAWVFAFGRHLVVIDARDPRRQVTAVLGNRGEDGETTRRAPSGREPENGIVDMRKIGESRLRVVDALSGVYDLILE